MSDMTASRRKMIHDHRKHADAHGPKQPFEIGIFKSKTGTAKAELVFVCNTCGEVIDRYTNRNTYAVPCKCGGLCIKQDK